MNGLFLIGLTFCASHTVYCNHPNHTDEILTNQNEDIPLLTTLPEGEIATTIIPPEDATEDQQVINETITKYGFPRDYTILELPGPELVADNEKYSVSNNLTSAGSGTYMLKVRTITEHFSYNGRYEETKLKKIENQELTISKGQFAEHIERKSGGYYVRTIGYTLDENGYQQFLIDLSTAKTITKEQESSIFVISSAPGGPGGNKVTISSTALGSLIGGNALG